MARAPFASRDVIRLARNSRSTGDRYGNCASVSSLIAAITMSLDCGIGAEKAATRMSLPIFSRFAMNERYWTASVAKRQAMKATPNAVTDVRAFFEIIL